MYILIYKKDKTVHDYMTSYNISNGVYEGSGINGQRIIQDVEKYYDIKEVDDDILPFYKYEKDPATGEEIRMFNDDPMFREGYFLYTYGKFKENPAYVDHDIAQDFHAPEIPDQYYSKDDAL